jgi:protoporphyrinogen oxidase
MAEPRIVILGAGPAGLGAAWKLRREAKASVTVVEQNTRVGGNAGSFQLAGQRVDFGSHRLHPACDPVVMADIRALLGDDLLDRPRHGRIQLRGRWIHFPLKPVDLLLHLDPGFAAATLRDAVYRPRFSRNGGAESFASVLWENLGPTICREFYFPYARKIWGLEPDQLSAIQARRRVSAGSFTKLVRKVLAQVPGMKPPGAGRFYYPRNGYGQICDAYAAAAGREGATLLLGSRVTGLHHRADAARQWSVAVERGGETDTLEADYVWSTIPVSLLPRIVRPPAPPPVLDACTRIEYRAMLLVYLTLPVDRFTEYDAHYFPGSSIAITRLSEPKNYAALTEPRGHTTLCAELPCAPDDEHWRAADGDLAALVARDLATAGIPLPAAPAGIAVRRLRHAYPVYRSGYEEPFRLIDEWIDSLPAFLSYGRQGLFAHDNTHHALYMAYAATDCLVDGRFDDAKWAAYRDVFATHVVED